MEMATKKQLWALYCLTKKDWRDKGLTKEQASQMLNELLAENLLITAIEEGYKAMKQVKEGNEIIYESDLQGRPIKNGKVYYMKEFSGCGSGALQVFDREFIKILKRLLKKKEKDRWEGYIGKHYIELGKGYRNIYYMYIDKFSYSNGHFAKLEAFYYTISSVLQEKGYKIYAYTRLD